MQLPYSKRPPLTSHPTADPASEPPGDKIGLVLSSGGGRGWAHIGAIHALKEMCIHPHIIVGCSMGAVIGGYEAVGKLSSLEDWALSLTKPKMLKYLDFRLGRNGFLAGSRLTEGIREHLGTLTIETIRQSHQISYAAIATNLKTHKEVVMESGDLITAMRASFSLPVIFETLRRGHLWLVDGGITSPLPTTTARHMGADIVIAVNLNSEVVGHESPLNIHMDNDHFASSQRKAPSFAETIFEPLNIMQERISRAQLGGTPPDVHIKPQLGNMGVLDFEQAAYAIAEGYDAVWRKKGDLEIAFKRKLPERPVTTVDIKPLEITFASPTRPLFGLVNPFITDIWQRFRPDSP